MSLTFIGPAGSCERRWIVYAMLRDNVQHHLEGGSPTVAFSALHGLGEALLYGEATVNALKLYDELSMIKPLLDKPIADLAVSNRTRAVQHLAFPLPENRATSLVSQIEWRPTYPLVGAVKLGDVFGSFVVELQHITTAAGPADVVNVIDT